MLQTGMQFIRVNGKFYQRAFILKIPLQYAFNLVGGAAMYKAFNWQRSRFVKARFFSLLPFRLHGNMEDDMAHILFWSGSNGWALQTPWYLLL